MKTRSLADGQQLVTRADMEAYMQGAFHAYDRNARQVYGARAVWCAPLRWTGALLRDGLFTLIGLAVVLWDVAVVACWAPRRREAELRRGGW